MTLTSAAGLTKALSVRSSHVENILRHAFIAELSSIAWQRDPYAALQVFNSEVDDSGFDVVLALGGALRYVQLKQSHAQKSPGHCSVRLDFSRLPGSCVVHMTYSAADLRLQAFRFLGSGPEKPMPNLDGSRVSRAPGRRSATGRQKTRENYRDVPVREFRGPMTAPTLLDHLFPGTTPR